ncbi:uncharacterized protein EKO05_0003319 [Ascochyta rabiei]|uniref:uncharacterized protein n=1 Tax=Didymella rabiei TaxID=5454 RepID=UPI00220597AF|nr:uncharacterized protein EKO05_0003319 [Ascochyta rabiei]UPX12781.1 hypothetical protein EKO05_0003319 [Ascochyta rabiei]
MIRGCCEALAVEHRDPLCSRVVWGSAISVRCMFAAVACVLQGGQTTRRRFGIGRVYCLLSIAVSRVRCGILSTPAVYAYGVWYTVYATVCGILSTLRCVVYCLRYHGWCTVYATVYGVLSTSAVYAYGVWYTVYATVCGILSTLRYVVYCLRYHGWCTVYATVDGVLSTSAVCAYRVHGPCMERSASARNTGSGEAHRGGRRSGC